MSDDDEDLPDALLRNCTARLLRALGGRLGNLTGEASVAALNRSELLEALGAVVDEQDSSLEPGQRAQARELLGGCLFPPAERPYDLPWWQRLAWAALFSLMLLVAAGGNTIVMWIVLAHRRMRTVTNYFLVNLSAADLLMSLLNCAFNFVFMISSDWQFGAAYCTVNNFVSYATVAASAFTLVAISVDRYRAIVRPLHHGLTRGRARTALLVIWVASGSLAAPCLAYSSVMTRRYAGGQSRRVCYMLWPDGMYPKSLTEYMYNIVFLGLTYLVPVSVMSVCYSLMARELWGGRAVGELTLRQQESIRSKRKVILMFIVVVTIFAVCWLPYHGFFIYAYHNQAMTHTSYVQHVYLAFYWLAMANAMVNPLIYYWMNARFRLYFQKIMCVCRCAARAKAELLELPVTRHSQSDTARSRLTQELQKTADPRTTAAARWPKRGRVDGALMTDTSTSGPASSLYE
ncbi:tachykinin-like peptides receptor 86C [Bacillus rossius redtenbacheri]|uniref:tachykinin-like peptides receptor 86C n=1 Tax=Bacillus rossius redtenbacheri TaxID=93214 RepID=UPI002FDDCFE4